MFPWRKSKKHLSLFLDMEVMDMDAIDTKNVYGCECVQICLSISISVSLA